MPILKAFPDAKAVVMPPIKEQEILVVVRGAGERTLPAASQLLKECLPAAEHHAIETSPFEQALHELCDLAHARARPWTLCLDGDVLVCRQGLQRLLQAGVDSEPHMLAIVAPVIDKFFGGPRHAGNHLYRTEWLCSARALIPAPGVSMRPESRMMEDMLAQGHPFLVTQDVLGLHDFEQYYRDIYRKACVHAVRQAVHAPLLERFWQRCAAQDADYRCALWGLRAGQILGAPLQLDIEQFPAQIDWLLRQQALSEKEALPPERWTLEQVETQISSFQSPLEYEAYAASRGAIRPGEQPSYHLVGRAFKLFGWHGGVPWLLGCGLTWLGQRLKHWVEGTPAAEKRRAP